MAAVRCSQATAGTRAPPTSAAAPPARHPTVLLGHGFDGSKDDMRRPAGHDHRVDESGTPDAAGGSWKNAHRPPSATASRHPPC
ncbi:hypothetical protein [Streptomyces sp. NPDC049915]|uniref:hypothetical protein n=1 Tax=Streptomyces sp. NPDC049915 TaxID=3155510 RepID=UPI003435D164